MSGDNCTNKMHACPQMCLGNTCGYVKKGLTLHAFVVKSYHKKNKSKMKQTKMQVIGFVLVDIKFVEVNRVSSKRTQIPPDSVMDRPANEGLRGCRGYGFRTPSPHPFSKKRWMTWPEAPIWRMTSSKADE